MEKDSELRVENIRLESKLKFFIFSFVGVFMFFMPVTIGGRSTIPLDHIVGYISKHLGGLTPYYAFIVIVAGAVLPFREGSWREDRVKTLFSIFKVAGAGVAVMALTNTGPAFLFERDMVPFLYDKLVISVGIIVPLGAVFLSFLVGYGLLEFIGVIMEPVMKPIWRTPGRSAIDAVASFVGSYSIGLLITNRVYREGKYTAKEACIIATGFSTVSATFMIIVAKTLGLMEIWNFYFWSTLIITFGVTAITVRVYPLASKEELTYDGRRVEAGSGEGGNILARAWREGFRSAENSVPLRKNIGENLRDGLRMACGILPTILSVGLLGLILAKYTPLFDILAYIFYPFTLLMKLPEPMLAAKASSVEIAEMFLPALLAKGAPLITRYVVGVVSISAILFFSAVIPCIVSTDIPLKIRDMLIVWVQRTILTIIIAGAVAHTFL